jgi:hypothetical protein
VRSRPSLAVSANSLTAESLMRLCSIQEPSSVAHRIEGSVMPVEMQADALECFRTRAGA